MAAIAQLVLAASAAVGAYVAWRGLHTWKAQLHGRNDYDLARRFLRATYKVRDEIYVVRAPKMMSGEIHAALHQAGVDDEEIGGPDPHPDTERAVYWRRWKGLAEALSDLQVEELEAEVLWAKDRQELTAEIQDSVAELYYAIWQHVRHQSDSIHADLDPKQLRELDDVLYMDPDPTAAEDEFTRRVREAVQEIEREVRPYMKIG